MDTNKSLTNGYSDVNGLKMYYEIHGDHGADLVLIHGGGSTIGTSFGKVLPLLAEDFRVIAVELQGHGHTSDRDGPESFEQDADDIAGLLQHLQVPKAVFLGFSNGGNVAIQLAARHPEAVTKLILASTFYKKEGFQPGFFEGMKQATIQDMPPSLQEAFLSINPEKDKLLAMFNKDRQRMEDFRDWEDGLLSSINVPVLIINGDRDIILSAHAVGMANLIQGARLMILPATHGGYLGAAESDEQNEEVIGMAIRVIRQFAKNGLNG